ncbi:DEAD/DEAH box helicase [Desulfonatronum thioautotrophicum]|uniref:DEAD/DEAH box helicase n=1 Tax=Desulfonatronum thioautotrophicum TaxID=617001 RepID=UPI00069A287E|nr:DEAD/DEAH box helicase [Desulfonatronum thioautotrophicum]
MIPSILSFQLEQGVKDFLRTSFAITTPYFHGMLDRFLDGPGNLFKGPYLSLGLPYRQGKGDRDFFPDIPLEYPPYLHQEQAFLRLSDPNYLLTIVASGTGSGKTECFQYPILGHCYQHRGEHGIKAVIIYPMNALATDQAKRFAEIIWKNPKLRGKLRVGLYVGQSEKAPTTHMTQEKVITNKETLRLHPPDILLTNYKMLDYLLIRPQDATLWAQNGPETLKYIVVDEFHTFDGAQGTDLACLLRRLKARLKSPKGHVCCVGTSATLGGPDSVQELTDYAGQVFDEPVGGDAIIGESKISAGEFLEDSLISRTEIVPADQVDQMQPVSFPNHADFLRRQMILWFSEDFRGEQDLPDPDWRIRLGRELKEHLFFQNLLKVMKGRVLPYAEIIPALERVTPSLATGDEVYKAALLHSILALASEARIPPDQMDPIHQSGQVTSEGGHAKKSRPFLQVRHQLWLRELRRMVASVDDPRLTYADDLNDQQLARHLPVLHCRECGSMGWGGLKRSHENQVVADLQRFYTEFFKSKPTKIIRVFPIANSPGANIPGKQEVDDQDKAFLRVFCPQCFVLGVDARRTECSACGAKDVVAVLVPDSTQQDGSHQDCPFCAAHRSLTLLGYQAASLTSVLISQLFASDFNDDKKLLTFSDNVQDAAHRAGFFAARTFRFTLRTAIQQYAQAKGEELDLEAFREGFTKYWNAKLDQERHVAMFIAPNMTWLRDYEAMTGQGRLPKGSRLPRDVNKRLSWEVLSEYTFSARIGRTLERTGSSIAHVDLERLAATTEQLALVLRNEIGDLRQVPSRQVTLFCLGLIMHLRCKGAILDPMLDAYIQDWGNVFLLSQRHIAWMPSFGPKTRAPAFLTTKKQVQRFDHLLGGQGKAKTWYEIWAMKCFGPWSPLLPSLLEAVLDQTLKTLCTTGILEERHQNHHRIWGLRPEALRVGLRVVQCRCNQCGHVVAITNQEQEFWDDAPCMRRTCSGRYAPRPAQTDYYATLYAGGDIERLYASEHTGMLQRDEREELEARFKAEAKDRKPWFPNLLSCTPTLEMGINIGSLSSTIQCSVPPSQANYLQRIGRAGRRDGNALNVTIAGAQPHDLYFYTAPQEMISGNVTSPGVFLDASAVLERQFTAFCFDRWVETGIAEAAIPAKIHKAVSAVESTKQSGFPYTLLNFIESRRSSLLEGFFTLFGTRLSPETRALVERFAEGDADQEGSLQHKILEGLFGLSRERKSLSSRIKRLGALIRKMKASPAKDKLFTTELENLEREKSALSALLRNINDKNTYNFFTDEGLLPNYAFPEAGIILQSIIWRKREQAGNGERKYETLVFEYERAARSGIQELAPANSFYAGGRRVQVDQIDLNVSEIEPWRLCANCSHAALADSAQVEPTCPRCGSPQWADQGRIRRMVRMRQVFATTPDRNSRISDDADVREPQFYNKQMLADCADQDITRAFRLDDDELPFGFEFLSKAVFRDINFGLRDSDGELVTIAGEELPRRGFVLCRHCGKIQTKNKKGEQKIEHALTCSARDKQAETVLAECVYLYREFSSEAVKLLLPLTSFSESSDKLHSFVAALHLGLQQHFRGNIDHLQTTVHSEPLPDSHLRKQYLVLYDTIPGGTGYLKELMRPETMIRLLELALETLTRCPCNQDENKDGCYACIFAYRNSRTMSQTSRTLAVEMLRELVLRKERLVPIDTLRNVPIKGLLESELEALFVEALKRGRKKGLSTALKKEVVNGKPGYFYTIDGQAYLIEPQVELGPAWGVAVHSRADFLIRPARERTDIKPIAVFTDGYAYHKDRVGLDLTQRMAIVHSGRFHVWSLTWKDVRDQIKSQGEYWNNSLGPGSMSGGTDYVNLLRKLGVEMLSEVWKKGSFDMLLEYLRHGRQTSFARLGFVEALLCLHLPTASNPDKIRAARDLARSFFPPDMLDDVLPPETEFASAKEGPQPPGHSCALHLFTATTSHAVRAEDPAGMHLACVLSDDQECPAFELYWTSFLRLYNLYQFLPYAMFMTASGLRDGLIDQLNWPGCVDRRWSAHGGAPHEFSLEGNKDRGLPAPAGVPTSRDADEGLETIWRDLQALTDAELHPLLESIHSQGISPPEAGYELANLEGEILACAELAWPDMRIAVLRPEEWDHAKAFEQQGWRVLALSDVLANHDLLLVKTVKEPS